MNDYETAKLLREDSTLLHEVEQLKEEPEKPDPRVEGAAILEAVVKFIARFVSLSNLQAIVIAVWVIHTYCMEAADATPYLYFSSPEKRSGKTRALEVLEILVYKPWFTGRVTAACLVRKLDAQHNCLLLDESDPQFASEE